MANKNDLRSDRIGMGVLHFSRPLGGKWLLGAALGLSLSISEGWTAREAVSFKEQVIDTKSGAGRAISIVDIDGDDQPDLLAANDEAVVWYENPSWEKHLVAKSPQGVIVHLTPQDVDGDGLPEVALACDWQIDNTDSGGAVYLLHRGESLDQPWKAVELATEPNLHRVLWTDLDGDKRSELVALPLKGKGSKPPYHEDKPVRVLRLDPPKEPFAQEWKVSVIDEKLLTVAHNLTAFDFDDDGRETLMVASLAGVTQFNATPETKEYSWNQVVPGNPVAFPYCGAGEIAVGEYGKDKIPFLATIEPWHGHQAVVYSLNLDGSEWRYFRMWKRHVLADDLVGGHAVGWADFDGDGEDEMVAGSRGKADAGKEPALKLFDLDFHPERDPQLKWKEQSLDEGGIAVEGLAIGDLDSDGDPDIAVIGRGTKNLKVFANIGK